MVQLQTFAQSYRYALRLNIEKYFPAIDHEILLRCLSAVLTDEDSLALIARIVASDDGVLNQEYQAPLFPGDDLMALCRARGLPIGNLTSRFWANCYLRPVDLFRSESAGLSGVPGPEATAQRQRPSFCPQAAPVCAGVCRGPDGLGHF